MNFDDILPEIGEYGTYQKLVLWFVLLPGTFPCGFQAYNQLFMAIVPDHWCRVPEVEERFPNSSQIIKQISIPFNNVTNAFSHCSRYDLDYENLFSEFFTENLTENEDKLSYLQSVHSNANVVSCDHGWHYELDEFTTSVVADWDLVCEKGFYPTLSLVLLGASGLVGNCIFGFIQDGLGRKPAFFIYLSILCFFGMATSFPTTFSTWLACRIGVGFTVPAIMVTPMVLALELVGPSQRTYTSVVMNVAYSFTLIILGGIVYFVRIWPQLSLATTIPFLGFFGYWWVMPESPRWLMAKGRVNEAYRIMSTIAKVNKKPLRKDFLQFLKKQNLYEDEKLEKEAAERSYGVTDLFKTRNLCKKTTILTFIWFTNTSVYVGLSYYAPALGGNPYLNFLLAGLSELPTYLFLWPSMEFWGRRWTLCFSMVIGGAACIATILTQEDQWVTLALYCIGKFGISSSFVVLPLMASELYPTVVRGVGLGVSSTAGMIGPIVIPLINYLGKEMMILPLVIMGVLLVLGGGSSLLLPETLHQHLPQTIEEGETFGREMTLKDYCNCCPRRKLKEKAMEPVMESAETVQNDTDDELQPLPDDEFFANSPYSSLRRYSFRKAQSEEIDFDKSKDEASAAGGKREKEIPAISLKKTKKQFKSNGSLDETDQPLLKNKAKVTVI